MDNASCPNCGHYNAMLFDRREGGVIIFSCRDCGCERQVDPWSCCGKRVEQRGLDMYCSVCERYSR